jgi:hypothetical protein
MERAQAAEVAEHRLDGACKRRMVVGEVADAADHGGCLGFCGIQTLLLCAEARRGTTMILITGATGRTGGESARDLAALVMGRPATTLAQFIHDHRAVFTP